MKLAFGKGVKEAIDARRGVVALESTVIAHGLPRPRNLETARLLERDVRDAGAVPATICLADGVQVVGASDQLLARLANEDGVADLDFLNSGSYEVEVACQRVPASISVKPLYDPAGSRVKA